MDGLLQLGRFLDPVCPERPVTRKSVPYGPEQLDQIGRAEMAGMRDSRRTAGGVI
jgi:hypothetical protein